MEVKDYSQALSDDRKKFADQNQMMRKTYNDEVDRLNKTHESQVSDLSKKYAEHAQKVEKDASDTIQLHSKNARESLLKKEGELTEKNRLQKEEFQRNNNGLRSEMNNRLSSLKDSYDKTLKDSNDGNMTKIAEQRQKFGDQSQELRGAYNKSIKDTEARSEQKAQDLAKNYRENLGRLEEDTRDTLDQRNRTTKSTVSKLKLDQNRALNDLREDFQKDRRDIKRESLAKIGDAQDSYRSAVNENNRQNKLALSNAEAAFDRRLEGKNQEVQDNIDNQKKNNAKFDDYMAKENDRSRKVTLDHQKEKNQLISKGLEDRDTTVKKLRQQMGEAKKAYESEKEMMDAFTDQTKRLSAASNNDRLQGIESKYQKVINDMSDKDNMRAKRASADQMLAMDELERGFNDDRKDFRHKLTEMADNSAYREEINRNESSRLKDQFDRAMQDKKVQLDQDRFERQISERSSQNDFKNIMKEKDVQRTMSGQRREKEFHDFMLAKEQDFNKQKTTLTDNYEKQNKALQEDSERNSRLEADSFRRRMDNINNENVKNQKLMSQLSEDNVTDLQKEYSKEKTEFIEKTRRDMYAMSMDQKEQHRKTVDATTESFEKRLTGKDKEIQRMQEFYENKLAVFQKNSKEEIDALKKNHALTTESEKRSTKEFLSSREKEFNKRLEAMRADYEVAMTKMVNHNDIKVSKLTQRYEDMISRMQNEHKAEVELMTRQNKEEYDKLLSASQERQESMKNQYELKIEKLRLANMNEEAKKEMRETAKA